MKMAYTNTQGSLYEIQSKIDLKSDISYAIRITYNVDTITVFVDDREMFTQKIHGKFMSLSNLTWGVNAGSTITPGVEVYKAAIIKGVDACVKIYSECNYSG